MTGSSPHLQGHLALGHISYICTETQKRRNAETKQKDKIEIRDGETWSVVETGRDRERGKEREEVRARGGEGGNHRLCQ